MEINLSMESIDLIRKGLMSLYSAIPATKEHYEEIKEVEYLYEMFTDIVKGDKR